MKKLNEAQLSEVRSAAVQVHEECYYDIAQMLAENGERFTHEVALEIAFDAGRMQQLDIMSKDTEKALDDIIYTTEGWKYIEKVSKGWFALG